MNENLYRVNENFLWMIEKSKRLNENLLQMNENSRRATEAAGLGIMSMKCYTKQGYIIERLGR